MKLVIFGRDSINTLCIEGTLIIDSYGSLFIGTIIILLGGSLKSSDEIKFKELSSSVIYVTTEKRSPIVNSGSSVNKQDCIITSKSGSSIISQFGTEYIKSSNINQIQLYFTSFNPVDSNPSPLSIYLNNQPISILESKDQQHYNSVIYFEDTNQMDTVQLSIISRGDIYLTGASVYSSNNQTQTYSSSDSDSSDINTAVLPLVSNFNIIILIFILFGIFLI